MDQKNHLMAGFFVRPPTLKTGNFEAIWSKDLKFLAIRDLNRLKKYVKYQEASSILRMSFALSKWPHLHKAYVVTVPFIQILAVQYLIWKFSHVASEVLFELAPISIHGWLCGTVL